MDRSFELSSQMFSNQIQLIIFGYNGLGRRNNITRSTVTKIILKVPVQLPYSLNTKEVTGGSSTHSVLKVGQSG